MGAMDDWLTHQVRSKRALVVFTRVHLWVLGVLAILFAVTDSVVARHLDTYTGGPLVIGVSLLLVAIVVAHHFGEEHHWRWAVFVPASTSIGIYLSSPARPDALTLPALMQVFVVVTTAQMYRARLTAFFTAIAVVCANLSALKLSDPVLATHIQVFSSASLVFTGVVLVLLCERADAQTRQLEAAVQLDPLTGLYNRAHFEETFERLLQDETRVEPAVLLLMDVDDFKGINDAGGHPAGDRTLVEIADVVRSVLAAPARVWRIGGDEFAAWCPVGPGDPQSYAKEIVGALSERASATCASSTPGSTVGLSVGSVVVPAGATPRSRDVFAAADADLYQHKSRVRQ